MTKKVYSAPIAVCWDLTYKCNLKCKHCCFGELNNHSDIAKEDISDERIFTLLDEFDEMGISTLEFAGGEPMLKKNFWEIMRYAASKRYRVYLVTNGLLLNKEKIKELKALNIGRMQISLDGFTKEVHEFIRGKNTFDKTIENIKMVLEERIPLIVATVVHKRNFMELSEFADYLYGMGVRNFRIQFILSLGNAQLNNEELILSEEEQKVALQRLYENPMIKEGKMNVILPCSYGMLIGKKKKVAKSDVFYTNGCGAGILHVNINPYGDVTACGILSDSAWSEGNIKAMDFKEIWKNPNGFKLWRNTYEEDGKCDKCTLHNECLMGCKLIALTNSEGSKVSKSFCWGKKES